MAAALDAGLSVTALHNRFFTRGLKKTFDMQKAVPAPTHEHTLRR
jgi:hypothetical protein